MNIETENKHFAKCYVIYKKRGAEGVYNYANKHKIPYKHCKYCECDTPQIGKDCLVCQTRND